MPIAAPYLSVRTGVELAVDPAADPWWDADGYLQPTGGWDFRLVPGVALTRLPHRLTWDLADAGGPFAGSGSASTRWSRAYDLEPAGEDIASVAELDDGFVVVGSTPGTRSWMARVDGAGLIQWEQRAQFTGPALGRPTDVHVLPSGDIAVGGTTGANVGARLGVFEPNGTPIWAQNYVDAAGDTIQLTSLVPTADGGFAFGGSVRRSLDKHPLIVKLDPLGGFQWASELELDPAVTACETSPLIETSAGRLVLCGQAKLRRRTGGDGDHRPRQRDPRRGGERRHARVRADVRRRPYRFTPGR